MLVRQIKKRDKEKEGSGTEIAPLPNISTFMIYYSRMATTEKAVLKKIKNSNIQLRGYSNIPLSVFPLS